MVRSRSEPARYPAMNERLKRLPTHPAALLEQQRHLLSARGVRAIDLASDEPESAPTAALRERLAAAASEVVGPPSSLGTDELRRAIAAYLERRFSVRLDPELEIQPTLGSEDPLFHLPQLLVQVPSEKDLVLYGEPGNTVFERGALFAEAWTYAIPLGPENQYAADPELVPEAVLRRAAVVFVASPHDPTGQVLSESGWRSWLAAREEFGFVLVADERGIDLSDGGPRPHSVLEFGKRGCVAVRSLGQRSGFAACPSGFLAGCPDVVARYRRFRAPHGAVPPDFVQVASAFAWSDDAHVAGRAAEVANVRARLAKHFRGLGLPIHETATGQSMWVQAPLGISAIDYAQRLAEVGILVAPGPWFGARQERWFRVSLGVSAKDCDAAIASWPR